MPQHYLIAVPLQSMDHNRPYRQHTGRPALFGLQVYLQQGFLQQSFLQRVNVILQGENAILQQGFLQQVFLQNLQNYI